MPLVPTFFIVAISQSISKMALLECTTVADAQECKACVETLMARSKKENEQLFKTAGSQNKKTTLSL